jgi:hypothetical protein
MRRLRAPTLRQWGCWHAWHTDTTRPGDDPTLIAWRYRVCRRCGLRVKTEERLAVPWSEQDLVARVRQLFPERQPVYLRDHGITELPLHGLNAILARHGLMIHTTKGRDPTRQVSCTLEHGRIQGFGLFELRPIRSHAVARAKRGPLGNRRGSQLKAGSGM